MNHRWILIVILNFTFQTFVEGTITRVDGVMAQAGCGLALSGYQASTSPLTPWGTGLEFKSP
jgi:hypothetical protein